MTFSFGSVIVCCKHSSRRYEIIQYDEIEGVNASGGPITFSYQGKRYLSYGEVGNPSVLGVFDSIVSQGLWEVLFDDENWLSRSGVTPVRPGFKGVSIALDPKTGELSRFWAMWEEKTLA